MELMLNRIAVLSDIHGNMPALEALAADLKKRPPDCVVNLGDHLSGPLWPCETAEYLMQQNWIHIAGNHDRNLVSLNQAEMIPSDRYAYQQLNEVQLAWLSAQPASFVLEGELLLFHGAPGDDRTYLLETVEHGRTRLASAGEIGQRLDSVEQHVVLCGHTHIPRAVQLADETLIINPGSVGLPAYDDTHPEPHIVENGSPHARYAVLERQADGWRAELIAVPYDHQQAARQAQRNQRSDWEIALHTGFMK
jgi:predicted phosphodiesterase